MSLGFIPTCFRCIRNFNNDFITEGMSIVTGIGFCGQKPVNLTKYVNTNTLKMNIPCVDFTTFSGNVDKNS